MTDATESTSSAPEAPTESPFSIALSGLEARWNDDPGVLDKINQILNTRLATIDHDTWRALDASMRKVVGPTAYDFLLGLSSIEDLGEIEQWPGLKPELAEFLGELVLVHGTDLATAYGLSERPNDWRGVTREILVDILSNRHNVRINVQKNNGEEIALETLPDGLLSLTNFFVQTIALIPTDVFAPGLVEDFRTAAAEALPPLSESEQRVAGG